MIDITLKRPPDEVKEAVVQFCARRAYRLSEPWYLEGVRIEAPDRLQDGPAKRGLLSSMLSGQQTPRVDLEIKKRRGNTSRIKITIGDHTDSTRLAYELQAYLNDDRSFEAACPPICPHCGNNVPNPIARYCGRCGHAFAPHTTGNYDHVLRPPPVLHGNGQRNRAAEDEPTPARPVRESAPADDIMPEAHRIECNEEPIDADETTATNDNDVVMEEHRLEIRDDQAVQVEDSTETPAPRAAEAIAVGEDEAESPDDRGANTSDEVVRGVDADDADSSKDVAAESGDEADERDSKSGDEDRPKRRMLAEE